MPISNDIFIKKYLKSLENGDATFLQVRDYQSSP